jgi:hypothetical protein
MTSLASWWEFVRFVFQEMGLQRCDISCWSYFDA